MEVEGGSNQPRLFGRFNGQNERISRTGGGAWPLAYAYGDVLQSSFQVVVFVTYSIHVHVRVLWCQLQKKIES